MMRGLTSFYFCQFLVAFVNCGSLPSNHIRTRIIQQAWTKMYGLENKAAPPAKVVLPDHPKFLKAFPWAPHLQQCTGITLKRLSSEKYTSDGKPPSWTKKEGVISGGPYPPWVKGADSDNIHLTRKVQTDIWLHQFPANCSHGKKFLIIDWAYDEGHGLGSQIHLITVALSLAMEFGRILVPNPRTFGRAQHEGCQGDSFGTLDCYFFPTTSSQCEEAALRILDSNMNKIDEFSDTEESVVQLLESTERAVHFEKPIDFRYESGAANIWGAPWRESQETVEVFGEVPIQDDNVRKASWWRAQASRFLLRWPSSHLCHLVNIARHETYGRDVAESHSIRLRSLNASNDGLIAGVNFTARSLETSLWSEIEPFIPRPIVNLHVRQGDKQTEMDIYPLSSFVWLAERLKFHVPTLQYMWLSSEMQSVVDEISFYPGWKVYFTKNLRQEGDMAMNEYEQKVGKRRLTEVSFVNLIIAEECDYFVGALGSNWCRLINELRLTGGKLKKGYLTTNIDEV